MPELPEVESVVRSLRDGFPSLIGLRISFVNVICSAVVSEGYSTIAGAALEGYRFVSVARQGKYLLFYLLGPAGEKQVFIVHLRMTGRIFMVPQSSAIERHTRLVVMLENDLALRFDDPRKFGRVWLVDDPLVVTGGLGPDALTMDFELFAERMTRQRRQLKPLLLDQTFVAGIGNIYADESLFRAGLHPLTNSSSLSRAELCRLHAAIISVLEEAVEAQGANIDGVFKAGSFVVSVYGREGAPCRNCGTAISKIRVGQRGTHVCSHCQSKRP